MNGVSQGVAAAIAYSPYQCAIFDAVEHGAGNLIVRATAGSGKSTTLVEACRRAKGSSILLAFNKAIADELVRRGVNGRTFHSLCCNPVIQFLGGSRKCRVEPDKLMKMIDGAVTYGQMTKDDAQLYGYFLAGKRGLVALGKQTGIGCLVPDSVEAWQEIIDHFGLELDSEAAEISRAIELAGKLLAASNNNTSMIDFNDMLYFAVLHGITLPRFDFVFIDEAQDTNAIQRAILRKLLHAGSRLIAVGDPSQAIYGFRGADSDAMPLLASEFQCRELPLTVSYRCASAIVEYAQQFDSHIEAAPNAAVGAVTALGNKWKAEQFQPSDLVVCRLNKPTIALAYTLLKARIPAKVMGTDIGKGLQALIRRMQAKGIDNLMAKLDEYTQREIQKAIAKKQESKAAQIQDKTDCILFLIDNLGENERTIPGLLALIDSLFADATTDKVVTLATIHKAKGLEANRVFWLNSGYTPKWARMDWQLVEENNLKFVAATRAKSELILIDANGKFDTAHTGH